MSNIAIKNIYYIVLYAWDKVKDISNKDEKNIEELENINDVIIELFLIEVSELVRRGISKDYINTVDQSKFIKGKINIPESIKLIGTNFVCHFDEYSDDINLNQIIKTILIRIVKLKKTKENHQKKSRELLLYFSNVKEIQLDNMKFNNIIYNKLNKKYRYIIDLGILIYNNSIPTEKYGNYEFIDIMKNEEEMSIIFEEFLRKFYKLHSNYKVNRRYYNWNLKPIENSNINLLPRMETDIELSLDNRKIIIDAKYYKNAFSSRYEGRKLISNNIYQMNAYLMQNLDEYKNLKGILIYPSNGYEIDESFYSDKGYYLEFKTINLNMEWKYIKKRLLEIIEL